MNLFSRNSSQARWSKCEAAAELITNKSPKVLEALAFGRKDKGIRNENSRFITKFEAEFGDNYISWIDDDLEKGEIPAAVFKTVLVGYGYMAYLDWKEITDLEGMVFHFNQILEVLNLEKISNKNVLLLKDKLGKFENFRMNERNATLISSLESHVQSLGREVVWFDENGDSYAFFIVPPEAAEKLVGLRLDRDHLFYNEVRI